MFRLTLLLKPLKIFKKFAKDDPKAFSHNVSEVQNNLGNLYLFVGDLDKAELYLKKAIKKDPTNINAIYNLACLESLRNNHTKALELLGILVNLDEGIIEQVLDDERFDNIKELKEFKALTEN